MDWGDPEAEEEREDWEIDPALAVVLWEGTVDETEAVMDRDDDTVPLVWDMLGEEHVPAPLLLLKLAVALAV